MPGNRALYDRAMEQSREFARQKNWEDALKQAVRALQEFPQDADARSSAAVALFNTLATSRAAAWGMKRRMAAASSTGRPTMADVTRRVLRVERRRYLAVADTLTS